MWPFQHWLSFSGWIPALVILCGLCSEMVFLTRIHKDHLPEWERLVAVYCMLKDTNNMMDVWLWNYGMILWSLGWLHLCRFRTQSCISVGECWTFWRVLFYALAGGTPSTWKGHLFLSHTKALSGFREARVAPCSHPSRLNSWPAPIWLGKHSAPSVQTALGNQNCSAFKNFFACKFSNF